MSSLWQNDEKSTCLQKYLQRIEENGKDRKMKESITNVAKTVCNYFGLLGEFSSRRDKVVLLFGQVQSGKTSHLLGILCKVADLQATNLLILLLTSDNNDLYAQTLSRTKNDLLGNSLFICGEKDFNEFKNQMSQNSNPVILALKKNSKILRDWKKFFSEEEFLRDKLLLIADDEADAASLNNFAYKLSENSNRRSVVHGAIEEIRKLSKLTFYLQVTGTPQALLLQQREEGDNNFRPCHECIIPVIDEYLGGNFFFPEDLETASSAVEVFPDSFLESQTWKEEIVEEIVLRGLIIGAQELLSNKKVANSLIHPSSFLKEHKQFADICEQKLEMIKKGYLRGTIKSKMKDSYEKWLSNYEFKKPFEEIYKFIPELLKRKTKVLVINSRTTKDSRQYMSWDEGCNFIIGGNTLGRGITIPNLVTGCYTRGPKNSKTPTKKQNQADTMWQHNRWFGYDRNRKLIKLFLPEQMYKNFRNCNKVNNEMVKFFNSKEVGECPCLGYPDNIQPTRITVLPQSLIKFPGGANYNFKDPSNDTAEDIDLLINSLSENKLFLSKENLKVYSGIDPDFILKIFKHIKDEDYLKHYQSIIKNNLSGDVSAVLIVCYNRGVSKKHGKLLSPDIREIGDETPDKLVVTLYEIKTQEDWADEDKWNADRLWVPNIKLPNPGLTYYSIKENQPNSQI